MTQVGDREWWCVTHRRNAEDCVGDTAVSQRLRTATHAVLLHQGYTEHQILVAEDYVHDSSDCEECFDEHGESLHAPGFEDLVYTAEILRVGFEAVGVPL